MRCWGDTLWENAATLAETEGLPIEPAPLMLHCRRCGDPFSPADESTDLGHKGMCIGCVEWCRDQDEQDMLIVNDEDRRARRRFYDGG